MRRAGQNPTDVEIVSIINKYDNDSGYIDFKVSVLIIMTRSSFNIFVNIGILFYNARRVQGKSSS